MSSDFEKSFVSRGKKFFLSTISVLTSRFVDYISREREKKKKSDREKEKVSSILPLIGLEMFPSHNMYELACKFLNYT